ncbi:MAG TPA: type VI secretion system ATPase TssH [Pirellulales bacterium]|jgi:type VI secretion system protein VasG|nr:type VI secretion system ATPase TssH [Pirellulales bacterium]
MAAINLKSLVGKLNPITRRALEGAAGLCLSRTNYNVEIEHWLLKLLEPADTDLTRILKHYDVDTSRANRELTKSLDGLKTGNARAPELSPEIVDLSREAWVTASLKYGSPMIRTGHLLVTLLSDRNLSGRLRSSSPELAKIPAEQLEKDLAALTSGTAEEAELARSQPSGAAAPAGGDGRPVAADSKTPSLDQFTTNLTDLARRKKIDPVLGRDTEVRQIIDILTRRRQNNPILTGEAGVGKTAVVEGFALKIAAGDVPDALKNVTLRTLDLGLLQAGAGVKGEFENRLRSVIDEVKASPTPIVIFIDEAHTLIGAGGAAGQGDAANLLKPALARGELRTIAATTWAEYKKYFEKDAALTRRFQVVKIEEPGEAAAVEMMRGLVDTLEKHHGVRILNEAVVEAVRLSNRYISGRQLPDKSVSLLDTACARVAMSHAAIPPAIEDLRRRYEQLGVSIAVLERENVTGGDHAEQVAELTEQRAEVKTELDALEKRWEKEKELVTQIRIIRDRLEGRPLVAKPAISKPAISKPDAGKPAAGPAGAAAGASSGAATATLEKPAASAAPLTAAEREKLRHELDRLNADLHEIQGETPLLQVCVDGQAVADVVAAWTGIPVGRMVSNEIQTVLNLKQKMEERIIGQSHALEAIAQSIRTSRAGLTDPRRPVGVFMLVGPSGTGKTETAITLAELLYGGVQNMTVINMSEFKEEHKVSLLMGSPPGYVGYGEGGVLTEAVRRRPYSVVLLDELEKSHPGVQEIFYQVFDKGQLRDGEGRDIDFKNTVILMTSNAATDTVMKLCADPDTMPDAAGLAEALRPELLKVFKPAFLGRISIIPYFPLSDEALRNIIELKLKQVQRRVEDNYDAEFSYSPDVVTMIAGRCKEVESGARNIDHIISRTLLPELSSEFLSRMAEGRSIGGVHIGVDKSGNFAYEIE